MLQQLQKDIDYKTFLEEFPRIHPNCEKIKGTVCGVYVETIADPKMRLIRQMYKLIDEFVKGKAMEKIFREIKIIYFWRIVK